MFFFQTKAVAPSWNVGPPLFPTQPRQVYIILGVNPTEETWQVKLREGMSPRFETKSKSNLETKNMDVTRLYG